MEITVAKEIITQAKKDEVYAGPMPEDDATCISEAKSIVEMAESAWSQNVRGPEVEAILKIASGGEHKNGGDPSGPDDEEQAPESSVEDLPENLTKVEPWENYGEDRVKDITEGVNFYLDNPPDDLSELLKHIWAYESAHKRRARILNHVKETLKRIGVEVDGEVAESETESGSESESEVSGSTAEEGSGEEGDPGQEDSEESEDGEDSTDEKLSRSTEGEGVPSDASDDSEPTPEQPSGEDRDKSDEGEPSAENQGERSDSGDGSETPYQKLVSGVEKELRHERLDVPTIPEESLPEIPWRWQDTSDAELQNLHMQFSSMAYYKAYIYARDERIAVHCKEAADAIRNELLVQLDVKGTDKVAIIEAKIESDGNVRKWRRLQRRHEQYAQAAKREMESYHKMVESLSRLESMRHNAWERSRR